jgi:uncharacterized membrane protein
MFAPLLVPIFWWLIQKIRQNWQRVDKWMIPVLSIGIPLSLMLVSWLFTWGVVLPLMDESEISSSLSFLGAQTMEEVFSASISRIWTGWTAYVLGFLFALGFVILLRHFRPQSDLEHEKSPTWVFITMLIIIGALLALGPDFLYLRDQFGYRLNTIFKFYFATWILWGLAAAYALSEIWRWGWRRILALAVLLPLAPILLDLYDEIRTTQLEEANTGIAYVVLGLYVIAWVVWIFSVGKAAISTKSIGAVLRRSLIILLMLPLLLGLFYPFLTLWTKTNHFNPDQGYSLDGASFIETRYPSDYQAIQWIRENLPLGVISEVVGGSYNPSYARISTHTGFPTVLGWPGHEGQWRGGYEEVGSRESDIATLYQSRRWSDAQIIIERYDIDYVYIGAVERTTYEYVAEQKFEIYMELVYMNDDVRIYARKGALFP